jgi:2'-5' RNA ligase
MARVRTFIAIDPGAEIRVQLLNVQRKLAREVPEVKWVDETNFHLTLLFLGEVRDRDLPDVCRCVARASLGFEAFSLEAKGIGCFPNPRRPRVVWAGIGEGAAEAIRLHDALEGPLLDLGCYRREERQFTPHITLGRSKSDDPGEQLARVLPQYRDWRAGDGFIREVLVMSSELMSQGPEYTVLGRAKLQR